MAAGVISGALLYIKDEFPEVNQSSFLQVHEAGTTLSYCYWSYLKKMDVTGSGGEVGVQVL